MKRAALGLIIFVAVAAALAAFTTISSGSRSAHQSGSYDEQLAACHSIPNGSVQDETETSRIFINLPRALYPADVTGYFKTVQGDATAGYVSNSGLPGNGLQATSNCSSTYFEFNGTGEVDLTVPGMSGAPAYSVHFIVVQESMPPSPAPAPSAQGTVRGTVMLGPTCPVEHYPSEPQCADKPYRTTIRVQPANPSIPYTTITSDVNGAFSVSLDPGTYTFVPVGSNGMLPTCRPQQVAVAAESSQSVSLTCDTGIR